MTLQRTDGPASQADVGLRPSAKSGHAANPTSRAATSRSNTEMPGEGPRGSPLLWPNWLRSRLMSSWLAAHPPPWLPSKRPAPFPLSPCCWRSGDERARHQPGAAGRQCHGVVSPRAGTSRQASGTARAGRAGGQSGRCPLATGCLGSDRADKDRLKEAEVAAGALKVSLHFVEARGPGDFDSAFSDMTRARVRFVSARRDLRGQDSQRRQARRSPRRAADEIRVGDQPENCQRPRRHHSTIGTGADRRFDSVVCRRVTARSRSAKPSAYLTHDRGQRVEACRQSREVATSH